MTPPTSHWLPREKSRRSPRSDWNHLSCQTQAQGYQDQVHFVHVFDAGLVPALDAVPVDLVAFFHQALQLSIQQWHLHALSHFFYGQ